MGSIDSEGNSNAAVQKLDDLEQIKLKKLKISYRINNAENIRKKLRAGLVYYKLLFSTFGLRNQNFDVLAAAKHRYECAGSVEELMQLLCQLDQIQSDGDEKVRIKRKELTKNINDELLPKADASVATAERFLVFTKKILNLISSDTGKETKNDVDMSDIESANFIDEVEGVDETEAKTNTDSESSSGFEDVSGGKTCKNEDTNHTTENMDQGSRETKSDMGILNQLKHSEIRRGRKTDNVTGVSKPWYQIEDMGNRIVLKIRLPNEENSSTIRLGLEDGGDTFVVYGSTFQLPFAVDQHLYIVRESTYQFLHYGRNLNIVIPKRNEKMVDLFRLAETTPRYRYRQQRQQDPLFSNPQYHRPMSWVW